MDFYLFICYESQRLEALQLGGVKCSSVMGQKCMREKRRCITLVSF